MLFENSKNAFQERKPSLEVNILSLNSCETIDEMIERIANAKKEGFVDSVVLGEYDLKIEEIIEKLEKIKETARENQIEIVMAPDNQFGRNISWGDIKREFKSHDASIEDTLMLDSHKPETIGVFIDKTGFTYVFPKTWHLKEVHRPVHKIPNTNIGITICGEIHHIKPEDLDGINILYNPSREGDDPYLKFRILNHYGSESLTKEEIRGILKEDVYYKNLLDDSQYDYNSPDYIPNYDSREAREKTFNDVVDQYFTASVSSKDSMYVEKIADALRERNIPVVRTDGVNTTGVLNQLPNISIKGLEYRDKYTRYELKVN